MLTAPSESDPVPMLRGATTRIVQGRVADPLALSATRRVKAKLPAVEAAPEMTPAGLRFKPAGSEPLATDHEYGVMPPLAVNVVLYPAPGDVGEAGQAEICST